MDRKTLITLILLTALSTLSLNMFLPSLPGIAAEFEVDYATVSVAIAGYLAVTGVLQLIAGPLSDRYGRRPVLLAALAIFAGASLICLLAQDITTFLAGRLLQGAVIAGHTMSMAIVRDRVEERKAASLIGYIAMAMAVAPMLGPVLGGVLESGFGWRASFAVYTVAGSLLLLWCAYDLEETRRSSDQSLKEQMRAYRDLLGQRRFWGFAMCSAFSTGAFYAFLTGTPLVASQSLGLSTSALGVYLGSITAGFMTGSFLSGRYSMRFGLIPMILAGRTVASVSMVIGLGFLASGIFTPASFFGLTIFVGLGNGLTMPNTNAGAMSVRPDLAGSAAGLGGSVNVAFGAILTWVTGLLLSAVPSPATLLTIMLIASAMGGIAALFARERAAIAA
ncbi:multidrug effflux MFS transporter [Thalassococcus sp. S3]|uniref:multidrug effflux MFS transporter n=1 Tax=Thalassococcus sp. S3 TaxID=2017482 RepID=UPI0010245DC0|nr:multidrug effflux MFS transporter [Thalassococcus sp. S3]QBF29871.1 Bcr/CflA family drug resistance efflux transporter [Thalassococcus sp. S3]